MNTTLLSVLVDTDLRTNEALTRAVVEETAAGTPWLTVE